MIQRRYIVDEPNEDCTHYFILASPRGSLSVGVCKYCLGGKLFENSIGARKEAGLDKNKEELEYKWGEIVLPRSKPVRVA